MKNLKNLLLAAPFVFLLLAPTVLAKDNFWRGPLGPHGRGGCANASWHAMKDDDHHLVYPDCILGEDDDEDEGETPEPSETPEATATPSGSATATPTATPTGTPVGSATPTATPTETPTATPTGSPLALTAQSGTSLQELLRELIEALKNLIQDED